MTVPTLEQLESLPSVRFPKGNSIPYSEDFSYYRGIPSDVDWYIARVGRSSISLVRVGHGVKGHYGNGSLLVRPEHLLLGAHVDQEKLNGE